MAGLRATPRYGLPNFELARRWAALDPEFDGPFLAVNLMRYRPFAEYADGRETDLTGREADDAYAPIGPLHHVGARVVLLADLAGQPAGEPHFHRLAIVRYPTRRSFIEMQELEEFRELHVHKDAGMEFTIIAAARPPERIGEGGAQGTLVVRLRRFAPGAVPGPEPEGVSEVARLDLDGIVVGDEREFDEARIDRVSSSALPKLTDISAVEDQIAMVLATPLLDALALAGANA